MTKVGIVGLGFMGWIHWLSYKKIEGIEVVAICETDEVKRTGDWTSIKGNFGPAGEKVDLSNIQTFDNLDEMLGQSDIDLVDICLPPSFHCEATVKALDAGKNVFCEKPMALTTDHCETMVEAAERNQKMLLVGHVLPFFPEYQFARDCIATKKFGKLLGGTFRRVISDPHWLPNFYDPQVVGGPLLDLHVHDAHLIRMVFGMPSSVDTVARFRGEVVEHFNSIFRFEDPAVVVSAVSGVIHQQGRPFNHGFEMHFEKATLQFEFAAFADEPESMPLKVLHHDGTVERPELKSDSDIAGFEAEIREVKSAIENQTESPILSGKLAKDAIKLCHLQTESAANRKPVVIS